MGRMASIKNVAGTIGSLFSTRTINYELLLKMSKPLGFGRRYRFA